MRKILQACTLLFALAAGALLVAPADAEAQCVSPEHCHNEPNGTQFCHPGMQGWAWEECKVESGFCQLSGGICSGMTYQDLPGDLDLSPAGTLRPTLGRVALGVLARADHGRLASCEGFVVAAEDAAEARQSVIVLQ